MGLPVALAPLWGAGLSVALTTPGATRPRGETRLSTMGLSVALRATL